MTILITGGAGFIGSNFMPYVLAQHKHIKIVNLDKLTYAGELSNLEELISNKRYTFVKGDNVFYGAGLGQSLQDNNNPDGGVIFTYNVQDPKRYGVVAFDNSNKGFSIEEKPEQPKLNFAVPGIYFYDNSVIDITKNMRPSKRGGLEITDVNKACLKQGKLNIQILDKGTAWLDTGTFNSLMQAAQFVQVIEERQRLKIGCIEEEQLLKPAPPLVKSGYGKDLQQLV